MKFKIDKNVPLKRRHAYGTWVEIAKKLCIGDSVVVDTLQHAETLIKTLQRRGRNGSRNKEGEKYRVWRTK